MIIKLIYCCLIYLILNVNCFAQAEHNFNSDLISNTQHTIGVSQHQYDGISVDALAVHDSWANLRGGNYRGLGVIGNLNLKAELDTEKLNWWKDAKFVFYAIAIYGRRPSLSVGDYQYTSSIDAFDTIEPYEIYYEQMLSNNKANLLIGIHDFTTEFSVLSYAVTLINSSFSTPSTITQLPYSFYPYTGLGARVFNELTDNVYLMTGVYDGKPNNQIHARSIDWGLSADDGAYIISELGYKSKKQKRNQKVAIGAWYNSGQYLDINGNSRRGNSGSYVIAEQKIWNENGDLEQGLGLFTQLGQAQQDRNYNPWYFATGVNYKGLFHARAEDTLTLAFNLATSSSRYRALHQNTDSNERVVELSYRSQITKSLSLTPDIQWVVNPGTQSSINNSFIFFVRSEVKF